MIKYLTRFYICLIVPFALVASLLVASVKPNAVKNTQNFFANVDEFVVFEEGLYALDDTNNTIYRYDLEGNFIHAITFPCILGPNRIFVREGSLHRLEVAKDIVYVYDTTGAIAEIYRADVDDLISEGYLQTHPQKTFEFHNVQYKFKDSLILDSRIVFGENEIVVESIWSHLVVINLILLGAGFYVLSVYNLIRFIIIKHKENNVK